MSSLRIGAQSVDLDQMAFYNPATKKGNAMMRRDSAQIRKVRPAGTSYQQASACPTVLLAQAYNTASAKAAASSDPGLHSTTAARIVKEPVRWVASGSTTILSSDNTEHCEIQDLNGCVSQSASMPLECEPDAASLAATEIGLDEPPPISPSPPTTTRDAFVLDPAARHVVAPSSQ
ncbi:hypothetical protein LTR48_005773 [Friedmanniomyces endolithicus]|nr:hypothetical protein LTR48_005773 [Friedmanniomyces endolithicus]